MTDAVRGAPPRKRIPEQGLINMGIPKIFWDQTIDDYEDGEVKDFIQKYVDNIFDMYDDCINILFAGPNGAGKTFAASLILKGAYLNRFTTKLINMNDIINLAYKRDGDYAEYETEFEKVTKSDFLVIDELGKESTTKSGNEIRLLSNILNMRDKQGLPFIICTNMNSKEIHSRYGPTVNSLLIQAVQINFIGTDKRSEVFRVKKSLKILEMEG